MTSMSHEADWSEIDRLLSDFWRRVHGALDVWTAVCYGGPDWGGYDGYGFVVYHSQALRQVLAAVPAALGKADWKNQDLDLLLFALTAACERFIKAFLVLAKHRQLPFEEVSDATETVRATYDEMGSLLGQIETVAKIEISFRELHGNTEREAYYQRILAHLDETFRQARSEPVSMVDANRR